MAGGYIGRSDGVQREIIDMHIGTSSGRKQVLGAYVGTAGGVKQWYNSTQDLVIHSSGAPAQGEVVFSWNQLGPSTKFSYNIYRDQVYLANLTASTFKDTGLAAARDYTYRVDSMRNGLLSDTASISIRTLDPPPPPPPPPPGPTLVYREGMTWAGSAVESASFELGDNRKRSTTHCYYGRLDSQRGNQHSQVRFNFPDAVRYHQSGPSCTAITRVQVSWYNLHTWYNSGGNVKMTMHHNGSLDKYYGDTGILRHPGDGDVTWPSYKPGYINGTSWFDLAWLIAPYNGASVAEVIRATGATGFGLRGYTTDIAGYGYAQGVSEGSIQCHLTYNGWVWG